MPLTSAEQAQLWPVLKDSPLVQKWADFRTILFPRLDLRTFGPGEIVFRPGDPPKHLFIVARGNVVMTLQEGGEPWYEQALQPGEFFGQQALFEESYRATARVPNRGEPALLLLMSATDLRVALERAPELREDLLHEARAGRLRRIPLFRDLNDDQIRWLAQLVQERDLPAGTSLPLDRLPGIWIVERGQLAVTGPLHPAPADWEVWRITAGNFLVARGNPELVPTTMQFGLNCAADTGFAQVDTHLFYLPAPHADRVITQYPDVGQLVHEPVDIIAVLDRAPLFGGLTARQRQHLAQFCSWEFVPERQNITTQGDPGNAYVMLRQGGALITAYDNYGRERPRSRLPVDAAYGVTSLTKGKARDATVRAVRGERVRGIPGLEGADLLTLDRRDLRYAIEEKPDLWAGTSLAQSLEETKSEKLAYSWMREGEIVRWEGRPHPFWLIWPLSLVLLLLLGLTALALALPGALSAAGTALIVIAGIILVPAAIIVVANYYDDYYVVTNRRVTRRDRQLFFFESREEAPVEMVQDVTIDTHFWGQIFNFGDVAVRTSSRSAPIRLNHTPEPMRVKDLLEETRTEAQAEERGRQKEDLRRALIKDLRLALPVPERQRALGNPPSPAPQSAQSRYKRIFRATPHRETIPTPPNTRAWLAERTHLVRKPPPSPAKELPGMIVWHKHWLDAIARMALPFLALVVLLVVGPLLVINPIQIPFANVTGLTLGWLVLFGLTVFWLWWEYTDYRNDVYIVTDDRVIDIEMKPLGLNAKRREGGLEKVQNVTLQQNGVWAKLFGYGHVVISTAALDEGFTFVMVPNPQSVQSQVFEKVNQFRARKDRLEAARRQQELIEALSVYHQLRGMPGQADGFSDRL